MRAALAIALAALAAAGVAQAETWKAYTPVNDKGLQWSYDADYSYRDAQTGRIVVLQAIGKPGSEPRMGPAGPGAPDGVGFVYALDCNAGALASLGGYTPKKPLEIAANWRKAKGKRAETADDKALLAAICPGADQLAAR
jgi:hypothetical protein